MKKVALTLDIETTTNFDKLTTFLNKYQILATFFVTGKVLAKTPGFFKRLQKQGHEIACHGFTHKRFDMLSEKEKRHELQNFLKLAKSAGINIYGFRAPQFSIDDKTLDLLEKFKFKYDSSYCPLSFLQLIFFPKYFRTYLRLIFSKNKTYFIRKNLKEIPISSFIFPISAFMLRYLPLPLCKILASLSYVLRNKLVFLAHSWDFNDDIIIKKFERIIKYFKAERYVTLKELL